MTVWFTKQNENLEHMNLGALHELPDEDLLRALNAMRQPTRQQVEKERKESGDMALMDLLAFTTQPRDTESDTRNDSPRCRPSNSYLRTLTQITRSPALGDGRVHDEEPLEARRDTTRYRPILSRGKILRHRVRALYRRGCFLGRRMMTETLNA